MRRSQTWMIRLVVPVLTLVGVGASNDPSSVDEALAAALDDEWRSAATYRAVIAELGDLRPFANIVNAEQCHADQLVALFESRALELPADRWQRREIEVAGSLAEACAAAIESERANVALYDAWLPRVDDAEITAVFNRLRLASLEHHLPAFERCASGKPAGGRGPGGREAGCAGNGGGCRGRRTAK